MNKKDEKQTELFLDRIQLSTSIIQKLSEVIGWKRDLHRYKIKNTNTKVDIENTAKYGMAWSHLMELYDFLQYKDFDSKKYSGKLKEEIDKLNKVMERLELSNHYPNYKIFILCYRTIRKVISKQGYQNMEMFDQDNNKPEWGSIYDEI